MREIQTAENKTLKLTNVVSRRIQPEEFNNMQIVLTQMHNFIKSNGAQPLGPLVQCIKLPAGPNPQPEVYMMQQATQLTGTVYTIFVNQDDDEGVVDTFMETK